MKMLSIVFIFVFGCMELSGANDGQSSAVELTPQEQSARAQQAAAREALSAHILQTSGARIISAEEAKSPERRQPVLPTRSPNQIPPLFAPAPALRPAAPVERPGCCAKCCCCCQLVAYGLRNFLSGR